MQHLGVDKGIFKIYFSLDFLSYEKILKLFYLFCPVSSN
jgi:hypothetical protein